jgi:hypothetical protein
VEHRRSASNSVRQSESCFLADQLPRFISFFKHRNEFYRVKKGDLLEALQWSAQDGVLPK